MLITLRQQLVRATTTTTTKATKGPSANGEITRRQRGLLLLTISCRCQQCVCVCVSPWGVAAAAHCDAAHQQVAIHWANRKPSDPLPKQSCICITNTWVCVCVYTHVCVCVLVLWAWPATLKFPRQFAENSNKNGGSAFFLKVFEQRWRNLQQQLLVTVKLDWKELTVRN